MTVIGFLSVFVFAWPVSVFASTTEIQTAAGNLMRQVVHYSVHHPEEPGCRAEWRDGRAGTPLLVSTYPETTHSFYIVPVLNNKGKTSSLISIDAQTAEWQWYTKQYAHDEFPPVSAAGARKAISIYLRKIGLASNFSEPLLVSPRNMKIYWWSTITPPGDRVREVFVPIEKSNKVYTASEMMSNLHENVNPLAVSPPQEPKMNEPTVSTHPHAYSISDLPYHSQETDWYCGEAALQMIFDYYGPLISQDDIANVANAKSGSGTRTDNLRRAAHFSSRSTALQNPDLQGYPERDIGYGAFENLWSYPSQYPNRYTDLKRLISQDFPILILAQNHYLVVKGYNDSLDVFVVHDPWPTQGPDVCLRQSFLIDSRWVGSERWGLFVSPWHIDIDTPKTVIQGRSFTVTATVSYIAPLPFGNGYDLVYEPLVSIILPSGFALDGDIRIRGLSSIVGPGDSETISWRVKALDRISLRDTISVSAWGLINGTSRSYGPYRDLIGSKSWDSLTTVTNIFLYDGYIVDDDTDGASRGDGDAIIDAGETIELSVNLTFVGDRPATHVSGIVSIPQPNSHVKLIKNTAHFGDTFGDTTLTCRDSFIFSVSEHCWEDRFVEFALEIVDSDSNTWKDSFKLLINSQSDIICNGDFSTGDISCWSFFHTSFTPVPRWNVSLDPERGSAVRITRNAPWNNDALARSSLVQDLYDADLTGQPVLLSFDVKVSSQTISCSNWCGPARVLLRYDDAEGESHDLWWTFYYSGWSPDSLAEKIVRNRWYHRVYDVTHLAPTATSLTQIKLFCEDLEWDVSFSNIDLSSIKDGTEKGDLNEDGSIDAMDVVLSGKIVTGMHTPTDGEHWTADINNDGRVDVADVMSIVKIITRK